MSRSVDRIAETIAALERCARERKMIMEKKKKEKEEETRARAEGALGGLRLASVARFTFLNSANSSANLDSRPFHSGKCRDPQLIATFASYTGPKSVSIIDARFEKDGDISHRSPLLAARPISNPYLFS